MLRSLRISTPSAPLQLDLPSYRRMPPPSRLPEIDIEDVAASASPRPRSTGVVLRGLVAALAGVVVRR